MQDNQTREGRRHSKTYWLAFATVMSLFVVNFMGFLDTITGSALGLGRNWPFDHGSIFPPVWTEAATIEWTHRVTVGVGEFFLLALAVTVLFKYRRNNAIKLYVGMSFAGILLEAALGAISVLFPNPPGVMAAHFGIAILSFVGVFLLWRYISDAETGGVRGRLIRRASAKQTRFAKAVYWSLPFGYVAMYVGAYVAYSGAGGMAQGWPFPTESFKVAGPLYFIDIFHRLIALTYLIWMVSLVVMSRKWKLHAPVLYRGSVTALVLVGLQAVSGALLIATHLSVPAFMLHVTIISLLFTTQCRLAMHCATGRKQTLTIIEGTPAKSRHKMARV